MNQALSFGLLLAGGVLLDSALTGHGPGAVVQGKAGSVSDTSNIGLGAILSNGVSGIGQAAGSAISGVGNRVGGLTSTGAGGAIAGVGNRVAGASPGPVAGTEIPNATWNPQGKAIADWIVPILQWASEHGWSGTVTSGYRTLAQQQSINASGAFSAPAGQSNHESVAYPGGAVDVSNSGQLLSVLSGYPGAQKLIGGVLGAVDPEHFSATGH